VGQTLTGSYTYSDTGGHAESGSTYAWFSSSNASGTYSPISGANAITYSATSSDVGNWLKFQVTPQSTVATGSSTASAAFGPVQSASSTQGPAISNIAVSGITTSGATITWTTSVAASATIEYGTSNSYGSTVNDSNVTTGGSVSLSGLSSNTTYHFAVIAYGNGTSTTSGDTTFTTGAVSTGGGGQVVNVPSDGGEGGGGGGSYVPPVSTPPPTSSSQSTSTLEAELQTLLAEYETLVSQASGNAGTPNSTQYNGNTSFQPFTKNLRFAESDPDVLRLQEYLNANGFVLAPSGPGSPGHEIVRFGSLTLKELKLFQAAHGIPDTGYFGPITRSYVNAHL